MPPKRWWPSTGSILARMGNALISILSALALLLGGVAGGFVGALTGLGGGVIIIPLLSIVLGFPLQLATGASLASTIATSSGAAAAYVKDGTTNIKIGMSLEVGTTLGAIVGAMTAAYIYSRGLSSLIFIAFGVVTLSSLYPTLSKMRGAAKNRPDSSTKLFQMEGRYHDANKGRWISYVGVRWWLGEAVMTLAGFISGLLGVGSGVLKVLGLDSAMRLPIKVSTATSNFMIGVTAVTGSAIYWALGYIQPELVAPIVIGVLFGSYAGSKVMKRAKGRTIRLAFSAILVIISVEMILRGLGIA